MSELPSLPGLRPKNSVSRSHVRNGRVSSAAVFTFGPSGSRTLQASNRLSRVADQISELGAHNGAELFYVNSNGARMSVPIVLSPELKLGRPTKLFEWARPPSVITARPYDISRVDGRFLMSRPVSSTAGGTINISVVVNWFNELRTLLPR